MPVKRTNEPLGTISGETELIPSDLEGVARTLKRDATSLLEQTQLLQLLNERFGAAALVGSTDLNLMTWRDIDLMAHVEISQKSDMLAALSALERNLADAGYVLIKAVFNDEWTHCRGDYGKGYYWGLRVRSQDVHEWKLDVWGWDRTTFAIKTEIHEELRTALSKMNRQQVLRLKTDVQALPEFRSQITSWNVYQFLLADRGTSLEEFLTYHSEL